MTHNPQIPDILEINVTDDDIFNGYRGNCFECPIARAIKRILTDPAIKVMVLGELITIIIAGHEDKVYIPPEEMTKFIRDFDKLLMVEPTKFTLKCYGTN